jgi:hypothetical protein
MSFLFGDLSPAPFKTNFLEELRDALDFAGGIAEADQTIVTADTKRDAARKRADVELGRLEGLAWAMIAAAEASDRGSADSPSARLASELGILVTERRQVSDAAVQRKLDEEIVKLDADVIAARADYLPTLQDWLLLRVPPKSKQTWGVELVPGAKKDHRYRATLDGESALGLAWTIELAIAEGTSWAAPVRVARLAEDLTIITPQLTGLIKKEIKNKSQKIDKHWVSGVVDNGETIVVELRAEVGEPEGFTLIVSPNAISLVRKGEADDPTVGAFPVAAEDEAALRELAGKLREMVRALPKQRLTVATFDRLPFDGKNVESQPKLVEVVARLVEDFAPMVDEIASRSRSDAELVLRRELDGKREELFMPKARLREKLAALDEGHQKLFAAVKRAINPKAPSEPKVNAAPISLTTIRSEIAQIQPPYVRRRSSGSMNAVVAPLLKERPPTYSSPTLEVVAESEAEPEVVEAEETPSSLSPPSSRTAILKDALKLARAATKEGRLDDAFRQYATIFGSAAFGAARPDDQRQALKLMFFGTQPKVANDEVKDTYRLTLPLLQALVLKDRDAADYELLGMAYVILEEPDKAMEIFKKALDVERAKNPASDLCGNLMRRVSQL